MGCKSRSFSIPKVNLPRRQGASLLDLEHRDEKVDFGTEIKLVMALTQSNYAVFQESHRDFADWPLNLLSTSLFEHELEGYKRKFPAKESKLFHKCRRMVHFLDYSEASKCQSSFVSRLVVVFLHMQRLTLCSVFTLSPNIEQFGQLKSLMNINVADLRCRYMYALNSYGAFLCIVQFWMTPY